MRFARRRSSSDRKATDRSICGGGRRGHHSELEPVCFIHSVVHYFTHPSTHASFQSCWERSCLCVSFKSLCFFDAVWDCGETLCHGERRKTPLVLFLFEIGRLLAIRGVVPLSQPWVLWQSTAAGESSRQSAWRLLTCWLVRLLYAPGASFPA